MVTTISGGASSPLTTAAQYSAHRIDRQQVERDARRRGQRDHGIERLGFAQAPIQPSLQSKVSATA
jgi:hypothetical protein